MKIPHTIPKTILRAYAPELTSIEQLKRQYQGRSLRSEDVTWDEISRDPKSLAQQCLELVIRDYTYFVTFTDERNAAEKLIYEQNLERWRRNERKRQSYERRLLQEQLQKSKGKLKLGSSKTRRKQSRSSVDLELEGITGQKIGKRLESLEEEGEEEGEDEENEEEEDEEHQEQEFEFIPMPCPEYKPWPPVLDCVNDLDRIQIVEELDVKDIPLPFAIRTISDNYYWSVATKEKWPDVLIDDHGGDWRQAYAEKHLWDALENFHPAHDDLNSLVEQVKLMSPYVKQLTLTNLIPFCFGVESRPKIFKPFVPDEELTGEDDGFVYAEELRRGAEVVMFHLGEDMDKEPGEGESGIDHENEDDNKIDSSNVIRGNNSHLDLSMIVEHLSVGALRKISLIYEMQDLGMDWELKYFDLTDTDVENLAKAISLVPTLECFELNKSRMTDEQCITLVKNGLRKLSRLQVLNLSYNCIGDIGAEAVSSFITETKAAESLDKLFLVRNKIRDEGGKALANALSLNSHLKLLDLRLNYVTDVAGIDFGKVLTMDNTTLRHLNFASNRLTEESCAVFGEMLKVNKSLVELDLSSNDLGMKGGEFLKDGLTENKSLIKIDVRLSNTGVHVEHFIVAHLEKNREVQQN